MCFSNTQTDHAMKDTDTGTASVSLYTFCSMVKRNCMQHRNKNNLLCSFLFCCLMLQGCSDSDKSTSQSSQKEKVQSRVLHIVASLNPTYFSGSLYNFCLFVQKECVHVSKKSACVSC